MAQHTKIEINRAPVLTLWAAVVAERLGLFEPTPEDLKEKRKETRGQFEVELLSRAVPAVTTPEGIRAEANDKPASPKAITKYLEAKFGESPKPARDAMVHLAKAVPPDQLAARAYRLYEQFRSEIPEGVAGWGAKGVLDLAAIEGLRKKRAA